MWVAIQGAYSSCHNHVTDIWKTLKEKYKRMFHYLNNKSHKEHNICVLYQTQTCFMSLQLALYLSQEFQ